jgi:adenylate cyclase
MTTEQKTTRKLAAILSADVKAYSRLMTEDETHTINTLKAYRDIISVAITLHSGRIVDALGDNILAEFTSVVNAVQCAVEIQNELKNKNADLPDDKQLKFRIGVNIGDVVQDGDSLYGEGVNIAARIEGLSYPGGVCISRGAYDHVKNKLNLGYEFIGEHFVKNIKDPVRIYRVLMEPEDTGKLIGEDPKPILKPAIWATVIVTAVILIFVGYQVFQKITTTEFEPASIEKMAFPLPDKPSIAVLPFDNMSDDPKQEFFSDGITEEIITALSKTDRLFVIAWNSTFTYKGKPVKIQQLAEELGVRYVLEGSVQKTKNQVRITAQLIDALSGNHLWVERYDRDLKDIFVLQDEITLKIVNALQIKLTDGEQMRMFATRYKTLDVKLKAMESYSFWQKGTIASRMQFGQLAQELIDMAPEAEIGYTNLGWHYWSLALAGKSPKESIAKAFKLAQKSLSLDEFNPFVYSLLSNLYTMVRQYDKAIAAGEKGVALNSNGAHNHCALGITLSFAGKVDEAIVHFKHAIRLDPFPNYYFYTHLSRCYIHNGQYEQALSEVKKALHVSPDAIYNHQALVVIYALLDREEEARAAAKKVLEMDHSYSVERASKGLPYRNKDDLNFILNAMRKAGLPD